MNFLMQHFWFDVAILPGPEPDGSFPLEQVALIAAGVLILAGIAVVGIVVAMRKNNRK